MGKGIPMKTMKFLVIASGFLVVNQMQGALKSLEDLHASAELKAQEAKQNLEKAAKAHEAANSQETKQETKINQLAAENAHLKATQDADKLKAALEALKQEQSGKAVTEKPQQHEAAVAEEAKPKAPAVKLTAQVQQHVADQKNAIASLENFHELSSDQQKKVLDQIAGTPESKKAFITAVKANTELANELRGTVSKTVDKLSETAKKSLGEKLGISPVTIPKLIGGLLSLAGLGGVGGIIFGDVENKGGKGTTGQATAAGTTGTPSDGETAAGGQAPTGVGGQVVEALFGKAQKALPMLSSQMESLKKTLVKKVSTLEQNLLSTAAEQLKKVSDSAGIVLGLGNKLLGEITDEMQTKLETALENPILKTLDPQDISQSIQTELAPLFNKLKGDVAEVLKDVRSGQKSYVTDADMKNALTQTSKALKQKYKDYFQNLYQEVVVKMNASDDADLKERIKQGVLGVANQDLAVIDEATKTELARTPAPAPQATQPASTSAETVTSADDLFAAPVATSMSTDLTTDQTSTNDTGE